MKKLLSILAAVGLSATAGATVTACSEPNDKSEEKGDFTVQLAKDTKMKVDELGKLEISNYKELKTSLEDFVLILPPIGPGKNVISSDYSFDDQLGIFTIKGLNLGSAEIQVMAVEKIKPQIDEPVKKFSNTLTIEVKESDRQLSDLIKDTNLGHLAKNTEILIVQAVENLNPDATEKVAIKKDKEDHPMITDTTAIMVAFKKGAFQGDVLVNFTYDHTPQVKDIVKETNLGSLPNNESSTIIEAVERLNPDAIGKVAVKKDSANETEATIVAKIEGDLLGDVLVHFTLK